MITIYNYTSQVLTTPKKEKKENVESKIASFAFRINNLTDSQALVDYAEELGLSVGNLRKASYGNYLTFGVSSDYDVNVVTSYSVIPNGVTIYRSDNIRKIADAIETMATKKELAEVYDSLRPKTYRELALGILKTNDPNLDKVKKVEPKKEKKNKDLNFTVSDHYLFLPDGQLIWKNPKDKVHFNIYTS